MRSAEHLAGVTVPSMYLSSRLQYLPGCHSCVVEPSTSSVLSSCFPVLDLTLR